VRESQRFAALPFGTTVALSLLEVTMIKVKTILVPTDFSDCSDAAVKYGYALAEAFGATIHLLNVVQDPYTMPWSADAFAAPIGDMITDWEAQARRRLVEIVPAASPAATVLKTLVGSPYSAIVRYAEQHHVDLVVVGTHGRGPLGHMLLGSVAERVVRTAPCPVLTVRHPQREFVIGELTDEKIAMIAGSPAS
jgi:nucleotide-binding universal stress UspA family protein